MTSDTGSMPAYEPIDFDTFSATPEGQRAPDDLSRIRAYDDRLRKDLFRQGLLTPDVESEIVNAGADQALRAGLVQDPAEYAAPIATTTPDESWVASQLHRSGDREKANAIFRSQAFRSRPDTAPETLARAEEEAAVDPATVNALTRKAVQAGQLPFAVVNDDEGNTIVEVDPELGQLSPEEIADLADTIPGGVDPRVLPKIAEQLTRKPGSNYTPAQARQETVFNKWLGEVGKTDEFLADQIDRAVAEYNRAGSVSDETRSALDRSLEALDVDREFAPATKRRLLDDVIKRAAKPEAYDPDRPEQHVQYLNDGSVWLPDQVVFNENEYKGTLDKLTAITPEQKEAAIALREARLAAIAPQYVDAMGADPEALDFYTEAKAAGKTDSQIATEWFGDKNRYSAVSNRLRSVGMGFADATKGFVESIQAMAFDDKDAMASLLARRENMARNEEYARLSGDSYGIGQAALTTAPQVAADLIVAGGASLVATPAAGAAILGARAAGTSAIRSLARSAVSAGTKSTLKTFIRGGAVRTATALATLGDDVVGQMARTAGTQSALAATTFARAAGSSYVSTYAALDAQKLPNGTPRYSDEEKRKIALGTATLSGVSTAAITLGFGALLGPGVEGLVSGKIGTTALRNVFRMTDDQIVAASKSAAVSILKSAGAEAPEEAADQLLSGIYEKVATGEEFRLGPALKEALEAGAVGGILGAGSGAIEAFAQSRNRNPLVTKLEEAGAPATAKAVEAVAAPATSDRGGLVEQPGLPPTPDTFSYGDEDQVDPQAQPRPVERGGLVEQPGLASTPDVFSYGDEGQVDPETQGLGAVRVTAEEIAADLDEVSIELAGLKVEPDGETEGQKARRQRRIQRLTAEKTRLSVMAKRAKADGGVWLNTSTTTGADAAAAAQEEADALTREIESLSVAPEGETKKAAAARTKSLEKATAARDAALERARAFTPQPVRRQGSPASAPAPETQPFPRVLPAAGLAPSPAIPGTPDPFSYGDEQQPTPEPVFVDDRDVAVTPEMGGGSAENIENVGGQGADTGVSAGVERAAPRLVVERAKDFKKTGNYEVQTAAGIRRMFRDPESGAWLDPDKRPAGFPNSVYPFAFLGDTKDEAVAKILSESAPAQTPKSETVAKDRDDRMVEDRARAGWVPNHNDFMAAEGLSAAKASALRKRITAAIRAAYPLVDVPPAAEMKTLKSLGQGDIKEGGKLVKIPVFADGRTAPFTNDPAVTAFQLSAGYSIAIPAGVKLNPAIAPTPDGKHVLSAIAGTGKIVSGKGEYNRPTYVQAEYVPTKAKRPFMASVNSLPPANFSILPGRVEWQGMKITPQTTESDVINHFFGPDEKAKQAVRVRTSDLPDTQVDMVVNSIQFAFLRELREFFLDPKDLPSGIDPSGFGHGTKKDYASFLAGRREHYLAAKPENHWNAKGAPASPYYFVDGEIKNATSAASRRPAAVVADGELSIDDIMDRAAARQAGEDDADAIVLLEDELTPDIVGGLRKMADIEQPLEPDLAAALASRLIRAAESKPEFRSALNRLAVEASGYPLGSAKRVAYSQTVRSMDATDLIATVATAVFGRPSLLANTDLRAMLAPSASTLSDGEVALAREENTKAAADLQLEGDFRKALERIARAAKYPRRYRAIAKAALQMQVLPVLHMVDHPASAYAGFYSGSSNSIHLNMASTNGRGLIDVLMHELLHAATAEAVRNPQTSKARALRDRLERYRIAVATISLPPQMQYAVSSLDEFITHAATDPVFQRVVRETVDRGRSVWDKIVEAIASFFGISNRDFVSDLWGFINHGAEYTNRASLLRTPVVLESQAAPAPTRRELPDPAEVESRTVAGRTVGTRSPKAKGVKGTGVDPELRIDLESARRDPKLYKKNAFLLASYAIVAKEFPALAARSAAATRALTDLDAAIELKRTDIARLATALTKSIKESRASRGRPLKGKAGRGAAMTALMEKEPGALASEWRAAKRHLKKLVARRPEVAKKATARIDEAAAKLTMEEADALYEGLKTATRDNLRALIELFPARLRDVAKLWYDGANIIAQDFSKAYNLSLEQASAVIAVFSPQKDWFMNVAIAKRTMDIWTNHQNTPFSDEMAKNFLDRAGQPQFVYDKKGEQQFNDPETKLDPKYTGGAVPIFNEDGTEIVDWSNWDAEKAARAVAEARLELAAMRGKTLAQLEGRHQAVFIRMHEEVNNPGRGFPIISPDGNFGGNKQTEPDKNGQTRDQKLGWGSYVTIDKAIAIMTASKENEMQVISDALGEQHKVRSFYNNIVDPQSKDGHVTMDTHAIAALLWQALSGASRAVTQNFGGAGTASSGVLGVNGLYPAFAEAYRALADELGMLPRQVQSITWEAIRILFPAKWKSQKSNVAKVERIWQDYRDGKLTADDARARIFELTGARTTGGPGSLAEPDWSQIFFGGKNPAGSQEADDQGVLPADRESVVGSGRGAVGSGMDRDAAGLPDGTAGRGGLTPAEYARHAELESRKDSLTPEEVREAEALVEKAARAAGFDTKGYHGNETGPIEELNRPVFLSADRREAEAYSEITDPDAVWERRLRTASQASADGVTLPARIDPADFEVSTMMDYSGPAFVPQLILSRDESLPWGQIPYDIFYWDGTETPYGDRNFVVISDRQADRDGRVIEASTSRTERLRPKVTPFVGSYFVKGPLWNDTDSRFEQEGTPGPVNTIAERLGGTPEYVQQWRSFLASRGLTGISTFSDDAPDVAQTVVFDSRAIKSADPFTGVPLAERFNPASPDLRFAQSPATGTATTDTLDRYLPQPPAGMQYAFEGTRGKYLAYVSRSNPNTITINRAGLNALIDGLDPANAKAIVRKIVNHELAHHAAFSAFTPAQITEMAGRLTAADVLAVANRYYEDTAGAAERVQQDLADGTLTAEAILEEWFRMQAEMIEDGVTTEKALAFHRKNPGMMERVLEYLRRFIASLWSRVAGPREDFATRVEISRFMREYRNIKRGWRAETPVPFSPDDATRDNRLMARGMYSAKDAEYLAAVEAGDMEKAQRMVDEAARAAGFSTTPMYHGTRQTGFTEFKQIGAPNGDVLGEAFYFTDDESHARLYAEEEMPEGADWMEWMTNFSERGQPLAPEGGIYKTYLKFNNPADVTSSVSPAQDARSARTRGHDAIIYRAPRPAQNDRGWEMGLREVAVFNSNQIKSADPVTRDDTGRVIPLSERFTPSSNDIRYALAPSDPRDPDTSLREAFEPLLHDWSKPYDPGTWWQRMFVDRFGDRRISSIPERRIQQLVAVSKTAQREHKALEKAIKKEGAPVDVLSAAMGSTAPNITAAQHAEIDATLTEMLDEASTLEDMDAQAAAVDEAFRVKDEMKRAAVTETTMLLKEQRDAAMDLLRRDFPATAEAVSKFRNSIDTLSGIVKEFFPEGSYIRHVFDQTGGIYLTRTYKLHHKDGDPLEILQDPEHAEAVEAAKEELLKAWVEIEAEKIMREAAASKLYVDRNTALESARALAAEKDMGLKLVEDYLLDHGSKAFYHGGSNFKADMTRLMAKNDVPESLRGLMEEITNPAENALRTALNVGMLAASMRFSQDLAEGGYRSGALVTRTQQQVFPDMIREADEDKFLETAFSVRFATLDPLPGYVFVGRPGKLPLYLPAWIVKAREERDFTALKDHRSIGKNSKKYGVGDLDDLLANPVVADVLESMLERNKKPKTVAEQAIHSAGALLAGATGVSLGVATLGSIGFYTRNAVGAVISVLSNGINPVSKEGLEAAKIAWDSFMNAESGWVTKLTALGILHDDTRPETVKELLKSELDRPGGLNLFEWVGRAIAKEAGQKVGGKIVEGAARLADLASAIDGFGKTVAFFHELRTLQKAYPDMSQQEAEQKAAEKVKRTFQARSQTVPVVDAFTTSSFGRLMAPFARFKSEMLRLVAEIPLMAREEMRSDNPVIKARGQARMVGYVSAMMFSIAAPAVISGFFGIGDDEEEALRSALPSYLRGNSLIYLRSRDGRSISSIDLTYAVQWSFVGDPISRMGRAFLRGEPGEGAEEAALWLRSQWLEEQIAAGAAMEALRNRTSDDKPIFLETDSFADRVTKLSAHLVGSAYTPQIGKVLVRSFEAARRGVPEDAAFFDTPGGIIVGHAMPVRPRSYLTEDLALRAFRSAAATNREVRSIPSVLKRRQVIDEVDIQSVVDDWFSSSVSMAEHTASLARGFESLGLNKNQIVRAMVGSGYSADRSRGLVFSGITPAPTITPSLRAGLIDAGNDAGDGGGVRLQRVQAALREKPKVIGTHRVDEGG